MGTRGRDGRRDAGPEGRGETDVFALPRPKVEEGQRRVRTRKGRWGRRVGEKIAAMR